MKWFRSFMWLTVTAAAVVALGTQNNSKIIYQSSISLWILHIEKVKPFFCCLNHTEIYKLTMTMAIELISFVVVVFELNHHNY